MMLGVAALIVVGATCGDNGVCVPPPCPAPPAFDLTVATAAGTVVPGLVISVSLPSGETSSCSYVSPVDLRYCSVSGSQGTYQLSISAPGFQSVHQTIQVTSYGTDGPCSCDIPKTQHFSFILAPA
jgi:hypothetical protein